MKLYLEQNETDLTLAIQYFSFFSFTNENKNSQVNWRSTVRKNEKQEGKEFRLEFEANFTWTATDDWVLFFPLVSISWNDVCIVLLECCCHALRSVSSSFSHNHWTSPLSCRNGERSSRQESRIKPEQDQNQNNPKRPSQKLFVLISELFAWYAAFFFAFARFSRHPHFCLFFLAFSLVFPCFCPFLLLVACFWVSSVSFVVISFVSFCFCVLLLQVVEKMRLIGVLLVLFSLLPTFSAALHVAGAKSPLSIKRTRDHWSKPSPNRHQYDNNGEWTACANGHYLDNNRKCSGECFCSSLSFCSFDYSCFLACLFNPSECMRALPGCASCSSSTVCTGCFAPFYLKGSRCVLRCGHGHRGSFQNKILCSSRWVLAHAGLSPFDWFCLFGHLCIFLLN